MHVPFPRPPRVALYIPTMRCGGAERMMAHLAIAFNALGVPVDFVLGSAEGPFMHLLPDSVRVIELRHLRMRHAIFRLAEYYSKERPFGVISRLILANITSVLAKKIARIDTHVLVTEANHLSTILKTRSTTRTRKMAIRWGLLPLARWTYHQADTVVSVSKGVGDDLKRTLALDRQSVRTIANPVVTPDIANRLTQHPNHPWFSDNGPPVIVSAGRLIEQKDHTTLLHAIARLQLQQPIRLVIFGDGPLRGELERLRNQLGLNDVCDFPGHCSNLYSALARARLFVLSSRNEGSPNVLTEALACGCPVVSTDCPCGPRELLDGTPCGILVPIGDVDSLANAIVDSLNRSWNPQLLKNQVAPFSAERSALEYLRAIGYPLENLSIATPDPIPSEYFTITAA